MKLYARFWFRRCRLSLAPLAQSDAPACAGTLLRGQPYLSELAWERAHFHNHQAYSLVGMIHTLAPPKVRQLIGEVLIAPVQPWDALICTSPAVRDCLTGLLDRWYDHLSKRFGGNHHVRPLLPLLPLGVDQQHLLEQRSDYASRSFLRRHLRLEEVDVLVLWIGRFFFEKAYPQSMFISCKPIYVLKIVYILLWLVGFLVEIKNMLIIAKQLKLMLRCTCSFLRW